MQLQHKFHNIKLPKICLNKKYVSNKKQIDSNTSLLDLNLMSVLACHCVLVSVLPMFYSHRHTASRT